jgi:hypothetical protein
MSKEYQWMPWYLKTIKSASLNVCYNQNPEKCVDSKLIFQDNYKLQKRKLPLFHNLAFKTTTIEVSIVNAILRFLCGMQYNKQTHT